MKKIIQSIARELRKTVVVILLDHAMGICPDGQFKVELAKFYFKNWNKL